MLKDNGESLEFKEQEPIREKETKAKESNNQPSGEVKIKRFNDKDVQELLNQGWSYDSIVEHFQKQGFQLALSDNRGRGRKKIDTNKIIELREKGSSYSDIVEYFKEHGIKVCIVTVQNICKELGIKKASKSPQNEAELKPISKIDDEKIFELRENGATYAKIVETLGELGIHVSITCIANKCKKIYKQKGKTQPRAIRKKIKGREHIILATEEIQKLREDGLAYSDIAEHFRSIDTPVSTSTIKRRCDTIYTGKVQPKAKKKFVPKKLPLNEDELFALRESGMSYNEISKYYEQRGIYASATTICKRCKEIYEKKKMKEPVLNRITAVDDDTVYELREKGFSYSYIVNYYAEQGVQVSLCTIENRCKKIYKEKGKEEPSAVRKTELNDDEIYELIQKKVPYKEIIELYRKRGIHISEPTISYRYKKICMKKEMESKIINEIDVNQTIIPHSVRDEKWNKLDMTIIDMDTIKRVLLNLKESRHATDAQLRKLAGLYNIDLDLDSEIELY